MRIVYRRKSLTKAFNYKGITADIRPEDFGLHSFWTGTLFPYACTREISDPASQYFVLGPGVTYLYIASCGGKNFAVRFILARVVF